MAIKFEFLPRARRCLPLEWRLPVFLGIIFLVSVMVAMSLRESSREVQLRYDQEVEAIEKRRLELASQTWALIPLPDTLNNVYDRIRNHNYSLIGPQPRWIELFQIFEEDLPQTAIIAKIENPRSGTSGPGSGSGFGFDENDFRLLVVVTDLETSNILFAKLSARKTLQGLSFTPKGETASQGRKGIGIEITFRLENAS